MQSKRTPWLCLFLSSGILLATGCGAGDFAEVSGTVTMDGKPLVDAQVWFECPGRRAALGVTDAEGRYEVRYSGKQTGSVIGKNTVRIETLLWNEGGQPIKGAIEVPMKYRDANKSELSADVQSGKNTFNFQLVGGKVQR